MTGPGVVWLIVKREFYSRIRTKGFLAATLIGLAAILAMNFLPGLLESMFGGKKVAIAVVAPETEIARAQALVDRLQSDLGDTLPNGDRRFVLSVGPSDRVALDRKIREGSIDAYIVVPPADAGGASAERFELVALNAPDSLTRARLAGALSSAVTYVRLRGQGLSPAQVQAAFTPVQLDVASIEPGKDSSAATGETWGLTYALVLLLYATIAIYGSYVAMGVIEEKSTRVVEILISTVRPFQLMVGKVLGLGMVALTQYGIWIGAGLALMAARGWIRGIELGPLTIRFSNLEPGLLAAFGVCFVLGFFAYASLFAAGGSMVSRSEDAQQITGPLTLILVVVFFMAIYAMENPDAPFTVVLSVLPMASPIVMFVRLAMGDPTPWQVALAVVLQVATIGVLLWAAGRIFRAGVLLYGKRLSPAVVLRALR